MLIPMTTQKYGTGLFKKDREQDRLAEQQAERAVLEKEERERQLLERTGSHGENCGGKRQKRRLKRKLKRERSEALQAETNW